jgi:hypothetical protein
VLKVIQDKFNKNTVLIVFGIICTLFLVKLDYHYFFTDEILYLQRGEEQLQGVFEDTLQVSPLPKYFAGLMYLIADTNLYLIRIPYTMMGMITAYLIYLIIKREFGTKFGLLGAILFATSNVIFDATRMVMLEPMMHLFWIGFHYFYYQTFKKIDMKLFVLSGVFLGLSLSVKLTSLILLPFIGVFFLFQFVNVKDKKTILLKNYGAMALGTFVTVLLGYLHMFYSLGIFKGITDTLRAIKDVYVTKSETGKIHVIGNSVYEHSPWWTYFYYHFANNGIIRSAYYVILLPLSIAMKNLYVAYWGLFFVLSALFHQFSGVKNVRYVSSIEVPLIMLSVAGIYYLYKKVNKEKIMDMVTIVICAGAFIGLVIHLYKLNYTEYLGVYKYFQKETNDFKEYKRIYIFGSVRSVKWYRDMVPDKNMLIYRKDYEVMCPEFGSFDYFAFDEQELLKTPTNYLYMYIQANLPHFDRVTSIDDMLVYKKKAPFVSNISCN